MITNERIEEILNENETDITAKTKSVCRDIERAVIEKYELMDAGFKEQYEYLRDGIECLLSALEHDPDDDCAESHIYVTFLQEFAEFSKSKGIKFVQDDDHSGFAITELSETMNAGLLKTPLFKSVIDKNQCALKTITDSQVNAVVRSKPWQEPVAILCYEKEDDPFPGTQIFSHHPLVPNSEMHKHRMKSENWVCVPVFDLPEQANALPDGFALVPIEPTQAMIHASESMPYWMTTNTEAHYKAMIFAAPKPERKFVDLRQIVSDGSKS